MSPHVSVAVMAHPRRETFVSELVAALDRPAQVVWDRYNDRWDTGRHAMLAHEPGATHHLVVQDDAIVCRNLVAGVEEALQHVPAPPGRPTPLCLYTGRVKTFRDAVRRSVGARTVSWLEMPSIYWGVAIVMPVELIDSIIRWGDTHPEISNYDYRMGQWCRANGISVWYPQPSLVDHRHSPSLVHGRSSAPSRRAYTFVGQRTSALDQAWHHGSVRISNWHPNQQPGRNTMPDNLHEMKLSELRDLARRNGLAISGTKPALIARLEAASSDEVADQREPVADEHEQGEEPLPQEAASAHPAVVEPARPSTPEDAPAPRPRRQQVYALTITAVRPEHVDRRWHEKNERLIQRRAIDAGHTPCGPVTIASQEARLQGKRTVTDYLYEVPVK